MHTSDSPCLFRIRSRNGVQSSQNELTLTDLTPFMIPVLTVFSVFDSFFRELVLVLTLCGFFNNCHKKVRPVFALMPRPGERLANTIRWWLGMNQQSRDARQPAPTCPTL